MPLSIKGDSLKAKFMKKYGSQKGQRVFYGKENADRKFRKVVRG